ncbi:hypothetical protein [Halostella litorea]|uniref:hypothetical protein n=1 Tax=Halostella litorea TaxID=2528831 RepID=UPI001091CAFE|nr:hypothetical protein [Halostella litorea]
MREIVSKVWSRWNGVLSTGASLVPSVADRSGRATRSADLYECSSCRAVLIEPPSDTCSQCAGGMLEKV